MRKHQLVMEVGPILEALMSCENHPGDRPAEGVEEPLLPKFGAGRELTNGRVLGSPEEQPME